MRRFLIAVVLMHSLVGLAGCGSRGKEQGIRLGMMPKLVGISYFQATGQGAREAAVELGVNLVYDGPTNARTEDQNKMIDTWVAQGFDIVAVAPNDPEAISATLRSAKDAGSIVLTWDTDANPEKSGRSVFVNQAPNDAIGAVLVDTMAELVQASGRPVAGKYLIVSGTATASNQNTWMNFMRERISERYPEMELLPVLTPGEDHRNAQEQTSEALAARSDLVGIWGITSVSLPAAAKAVRDAGKSGKVQVTGLGLPNELREYVKDGTVGKFVLWDAVDLGYLTVHVAKRLKDDSLVPGTHDMGRLKGIVVTQGEVILGPPLVFDADNIDNYDF